MAQLGFQTLILELNNASKIVGYQI